MSKEREKIQTNLLNATDNDENKDVFRKLLIFMILLAVIPMFLLNNYEFRKPQIDLISALAAIVAANFIIFIYIYLAFNEPIENSKKQKKNL
eukprot:snap_masked-scaffold_22-processed-gene-3.2-mRNA-1 protein AED:1.00 eAED:1.00 QI:0/0/0/0/1/1/2/0/91